MANANEPDTSSDRVIEFCTSDGYFKLTLHDDSSHKFEKSDDRENWTDFSFARAVDYKTDPLGAAIAQAENASDVGVLVATVARLLTSAAPESGRY